MLPQSMFRLSETMRARQGIDTDLRHVWSRVGGRRSAQKGKHRWVLEAFRPGWGRRVRVVYFPCFMTLGLGEESAMLYRRFGKTELQVSALSFGAMRIPDGSDENAVATIRRAVEVGINHLETARGYGRSEELLGLAMPDLPRDKLIITTKIGPTETANEMWRYIFESLKRMRVNRIDNFGIHGINNRDILRQTLKKGGCLDAVRRAMGEGVIGHVGFSTHGPVDVIIEAIDSGEFESVNLHYYYFNQRNAPAVRRARELDMGVFIISPTDKGGQLFKAPEKLRRLVAPHTPIQFNDRWLLSDPDVHTLSVGASAPEDFDEHVAVADSAGPLAAWEIAVVERLEGEMRRALGETRCTVCHECMPCPENITIPEMLRLRNVARALDMVEFGRYRYNLFSHGGHWFPGEQATACTECGECLPRCPEKLAIPALLMDAHRLLIGDPESHLYARND